MINFWKGGRNLDKKVLDRGLYVYLVVFLLILALFTVVQINVNNLIQNNHDQVIKLDSFSSPDTETNMEYRRLDQNNPNSYEFKTTISKTELNKLNAENYELMVYQFTSQWYKIYFNGVLIGGSGDYQNNNSNIWNEFSKYSLPKQLIKANNEIKVQAYAVYEIGPLNLPLIISSSDLGNKIYNWFNLVIEAAYFIMVGMVIVNFFLLAYISNLVSTGKKEYICYILSNIFLIPAVFDYLTIYQMPCSLLTFKKIIMFSNAAIVIFISYGLYYKFKKKINLGAGTGLLIVTIFVLLRYNTVISFINSWWLVLILVIINLLTWFYTTAVKFKQSYIAKVMFFTSLFALYDPINILVLSYFNINLGITANRFLVFPLSFILVTLYHYVELSQTIAQEQNKSELMYQRAIRDEMTNTYNHQYIVDLIEEKQEENYSLIMLDIDDFKKINDNYGHQTGDYVIKYVVEEIRNNIRKNDVIGRYGGDEFIIILDDCPQQNAEQIAKKIKKDIKEVHKTPQNHELQITVSVGVHYVGKEKEKREILKRVDQNLYQAKKLGKDKVIAE